MLLLLLITNNFEFVTFLNTLFTIKRTPAVFKNRRTVSLNASEIFIFVTVCYFSNIENLQITYTIILLTDATRQVIRIEIKLTKTG